MNSKEPQGSSCMTCGQLFLLFCDDSGFSHDEAHFSRRIDDKILEAALTLAQPKKTLEWSKKWIKVNINVNT